MEKSTDELMNVLKSHKDYKTFFQEEIGEMIFKSLDEYLCVLLKEKDLKKSEVIDKSNLDKNYAYQLFNGIKKNPSRNKILMLAFGMKLNLSETRKLLKIAGLPDLYPRFPRDSVIIFCINNNKNLIEVNEMLDDYSLNILE
ncbi:MAG: XRE family transcriptional regulator [Clostridia bacterium]|nr:XRE family transcriptional regulator [Clostridia bacterium]